MRAQEQPAADGEIGAADANTVAEEQPIGNDGEKTDPEEPEIEETENSSDSPAFAGEDTIDGVKVSVTADGGGISGGSNAFGEEAIRQ